MRTKVTQVTYENPKVTQITYENPSFAKVTQVTYENPSLIVASNSGIQGTVIVKHQT